MLGRQEQQMSTHPYLYGTINQKYGREKTLLVNISATLTCPAGRGGVSRTVSSYAGDGG